MKRLPAAVSRALIVFLVAGQALFVAAYVGSEHTIYFWDHAMYFNMAREAYGLFAQDFPTGLAVLRQSLANNYNLLFALPSFFSFALFGPTRLVFILTNYLVFILAYEIAVAFLLRTALKCTWSFALIASLVSAALIPPLWLPLLEGYPDSGAAACIVLAAALSFSQPKQTRQIIIRALGLGLALGCAVLLRRHFVYPAIALLATLACFTGKEIWCAKKNRAQQAARAAIYFATCGAGFIGILVLLAPDFLYSALTTDYGALYFSYKRPPVIFLRFILGGFGFALLLAALSGFVLLARASNAGRRLAAFVALYTFLWLIIWCAGPDQMGHHYILHALPLFVSIGLAGWGLYFTGKQGRKKYALGGLVALILAVNSGWALWFSPNGVWPNDNGRPGLFSAARPPVVRSDYDEWLNLANYLRRTTSPDDRIMMVGSSFVFNQDLLRKVYTDIAGAPDMDWRFVRAPEIDHEEPPPLDAFAAANVYLVPTPPQYHLDPSGQKVVGAAANQFPPPSSREELFHEDKTDFHLADGVTVKVWRRAAWTPVALHEALTEIRRDGPQDANFMQDWVTAAQPLQTQIHTNQQGLTFANSLFNPARKTLRLFFDYPLPSGEQRLAFAAASDCPNPQFLLTVLAPEDGHVEVSKALPAAAGRIDVSQPFTISGPPGKNHFLELDFKTLPAALCRMELGNLRVEKMPDRLAKLSGNAYFAVPFSGDPMPDIKIKSLDEREFGGYCAMPPNQRGAGIIVIQEIFGVSAAMRKICDDFAAKGYIAVCPDLFWRQQPGVQLTDKTPAEWDRGFALYKSFDVEAGVRDLLATLAHVRSMKGCSGKVGASGYCLGGKLAYLMASRSDVDACVAYYGGGIDELLDEVYDIRMPLMLHFAALDKFITQPIREKIFTAIRKNPAIEAYVYERVDHAFARPEGQNYNKEAAELANSRTIQFFAKSLQG